MQLLKYGEDRHGNKKNSQNCDINGIHFVRYFVKLLAYFIGWKFLIHFLKNNANFRSKYYEQDALDYSYHRPGKYPINTHLINLLFIQCAGEERDFRDSLDPLVKALSAFIIYLACLTSFTD